MDEDAVAPLQLDPAYLTACEPRPLPELALVRGILLRSLLDLHKARHRRSALNFIESDDFDCFCTLIGWDTATVRQAVARGLRLRDNKKAVGA